MESEERALSRPLQHAGGATSWKLGQGIFISYHIKNKEFASILNRELHRQNYDSVAISDKRSMNQDFAEPVSVENILKQDWGSKLGVLILTEDYLMDSLDCMLELEAFVAGEMKLLPLFFGISVSEIKENQRARWEEQWKKCPEVDEGVIKSWRHALDAVNRFNGQKYHHMMDIDQCWCVNEIVKLVTDIIPPLISFIDEDVCGNDRLCKLVNNKYEQCESKCSSNDRVASTSASCGVGDVLVVVAIYGFLGLGKTTLCKCLCDFYSVVFNGKVCHVDLGSTPYEKISSQTYSSMACLKRMEYMLSQLTHNKNGSHSDNIFQLKEDLKTRFSKMTDPVFLAIDNILPGRKSHEEVEFYLSLKFSKGSKIFLTSRSRGILRNLASHYDNLVIVPASMPALEQSEARNILLNQFWGLHQDGISMVEDEANALVNMCIISSRQYHPGMLRSLAAFVKLGRTRNLDWRGRLTKLRSDGIVNKEVIWKPVFDDLDATYKGLSEEAKIMFLALTLFCRATCRDGAISGWIYSVYWHLGKMKTDEIFSQLQDVGFIEEESPPFNLLNDFSKYKLTQGLGPDFVVVEDGGHWPRNLPRYAKLVQISGCGYDKPSTLDLRNLESVEVLHLVNNAGLQKVLLSPTTCAHLRSLIVRVPHGTSLCLTVDGQASCSNALWFEVEGDVTTPFRPSTREISSPHRMPWAHTDVF